MNLEALNQLTDALATCGQAYLKKPARPEKASLFSSLFKYYHQNHYPAQLLVELQSPGALWRKAPSDLNKQACLLQMLINVYLCIEQSRTFLSEVHAIVSQYMPDVKQMTELIYKQEVTDQIGDDAYSVPQLKPDHYCKALEKTLDELRGVRVDQVTPIVVPWAQVLSATEAVLTQINPLTPLPLAEALPLKPNLYLNAQR